MKTKMRFTLLAAVAAGAMALMGTPAQAGDHYRHHDFYSRGYSHVYYGGGGYYGGTRCYTTSPYYYGDYYPPVYYAPRPTVYLPPLPFVQIGVGN